MVRAVNHNVMEYSRIQNYVSLREAVFITILTNETNVCFTGFILLSEIFDITSAYK